MILVPTSYVQNIDYHYRSNLLQNHKYHTKINVYGNLYPTLSIHAFNKTVHNGLNLKVQAELFNSQYHACWYPGSFRCQDISVHDNDYV